ncbi:Splicing factor U2af subunit [Chionoecetes opilio]|uniref:Splicing factor U2af subunit n=1 Tax=Chionoecetes opilio TaxID=41210 RepID=A0A8J8WCI0_CHIOP|nr:Splicing factor U2af subunit [Chionoecetes opilio]
MWIEGAEYSAETTVSDEEMQEHYDNFFEEVFVECEDRYGEIEEMNVCDNLGDHLVGNVYIKFKYEEDAEKGVVDLNNRWFGGRAINAELSPVTDFREACCRQYEMGECTRSGFCNFMHLKPISRELRRELYSRKRRSPLMTGRLPPHRPQPGSNRHRSRSRSPRSPRSSSRSRSVRREYREDSGSVERFRSHSQDKEREGRFGRF